MVEEKRCSEEPGTLDVFPSDRSNNDMRRRIFVAVGMSGLLLSESIKFRLNIHNECPESLEGVENDCPDSRRKIRCMCHLFALFDCVLPISDQKCM